MNPPPSANQAWLLAGARSLTQPSDVFQISPDCEQFVHGLKLRPIEWRTLFSVDGYRSVREIGSMLGLDEQTTRDIFGKLAVLRVIETEEITLDQFLDRRPPGLAGDPPPGLAIGPAKHAHALPAESSEEKAPAQRAASVTVFSSAAPMPEESEPARAAEPAPADHAPAPAAVVEQPTATTEEAVPETKNESPKEESLAPAAEKLVEQDTPTDAEPAKLSSEPEPESSQPEPPAPEPIVTEAPKQDESAPAPVENDAPVENKTPNDSEPAPAAEAEPVKSDEPTAVGAEPEPATTPEPTLEKSPDAEESGPSTPTTSAAAEAPAANLIEPPAVAEPGAAPAEVPEPSPEPAVAEKVDPRPAPVIVPTTPVTPPPTPLEGQAPAPAPTIPLVGAPPARPPALPPRPLVRSIFDDLAASRGPHLELPRTTRVPANTAGYAPSSGMQGTAPIPAAPLLRNRPATSPTARSADAPFRFEPSPAAGSEPSPSVPAAPSSERLPPPLVSPTTAIRPVTPLPPPPQRPVISPRIIPAPVAVPPLSSPPFSMPASVAPAPVVAAPAPISLAKPFRLSAVIDFIMKQAGGGVIGQLAVYRVLLQVPPELLREAGIRSLEFDRAMEMEVRGPELQRALTTAVEKTLEVQVPPGQFTR